MLYKSMNGLITKMAKKFKNDYEVIRRQKYCWYI